MPNQAGLLYHLQSVDLEIARRRARLKAIETQLNHDETIAQATQTLDQAEQALKPWQTRTRELELENKTISEKIAAAENDLYGGRISSPKALQDIQAEIEALKRRQSQLEDELLEAMVEVESAQTAVSKAKQALSDARGALASQQVELIAEQKHLLEVELPQIEADRAAEASHIAPDSLATYEKLRPKLRGQAVALLREDVCSACGVGQTSTVEQQVHLGRVLAFCASCGRILADIS